MDSIDHWRASPGLGCLYYSEVQCWLQVQYKAEYKEYKTEPVTPGLHPEPYSYPGVPFTPSPSSSGCESPGTVR